MAEQLVNSVVGFLNEDLDTSDVTVTVTDGAIFPAGGDFRIRIGTELLKVTARSGHDLTVVRGQEGSSASNHRKGDPVQVVLTAEGLSTYVSENGGGGGGGSGGTVYSTWADKPASPADSGSLWVQKNGPMIAAVESGAWVYKAFDNRIRPIALETGFSDYNMGTQTWDITNGFAEVYGPAGAGGTYRGKIKNLAATSNYTVSTMLAHHSVTHDLGSRKNAGIILRESSSSKVIAFSHGHEGNRITVDLWTNDSTFSSSVYLKDSWSCGFLYGRVSMFKIEDNGTDRIYYAGTPELGYVRVFSHGRTTHCTPDQVGIGFRCQGTQDGIARFYHFEEE